LFVYAVHILQERILTFMKNNRLGTIFIVIALSLMIFMVASCAVWGADAEDTSERRETRSPETEDVDGADVEGDPESNDPGDPNQPSLPDNVIIRTDKEGLVQVRIENGLATIRFDFEQWEKLHGSFNDVADYVDNMREGPFAIKGLTGSVKDACIGKVEYLDPYLRQNFVSPSVVLLMADGRLHWFLADPYETAIIGDHWEVYAGALPWMDGIVSLSYERELSFETDNTGSGAMTIFADDVEGRRYDLRIPCRFQSLFLDEWIGELESEYFDSMLYCSIKFYEDGRVTMKKTVDIWGLGNGPELLEIYEGTFYMSIAEGEKYRPGILVFDMYIDWWIWEGDGVIDSPRELKSAYFAEIDRRGNLNLWLADGDVLHRASGIPVEYYFLSNVFV